MNSPYTLLPNGFYTKDDGTGPYVQGPVGTFGLAGTGSGGGGGGGGAVTVADGADVAEGSTGDAAAAAGGAGTVSAKLRRISAQLPAALGVAASAASLATVTASDDAVIGAVNETAPATDTASSGLNGRLQRIAQRLTSLIALLPASLGIKTAAGSLSIAPASDASFVTTVADGANVTQGAIADAAVAAGATGTVSAKLRSISRDIAALIAQLPATLGIKTAANSLSIAPASDAVFPIASSPATLTDRSGTITSGGTAQQLEASAATRRGYMIQNNSVGDLWVSTLATAVQSQPSIRIPPNTMFETPLGGGGTGAISLIGATTGQAFTARTWV